jgi:hypothetical protein
MEMVRGRGMMGGGNRVGIEHVEKELHTVG